MKDRSVRSLLHLQDTASSARVLNLHRVWRMATSTGEGADDEEARPPLFAAPELDRAIIIKHRLRRDEIDLFDRPRATATKVVLPIDVGDLKIGGRAFFVGERAYGDTLREAFGDDFLSSRDHGVLKALDQTPSLDPFLLRERLKMQGIDPARRYFEISRADLSGMMAFAQAHLAPLVRISFADDPQESRAARLVAKILSSDVGQELDPLRDTLRMTPAEYGEGMFCWKGFLYYKWRLRALMNEVDGIARQIDQVRPYGDQDLETRAYLARSRATLGRAVLAACAAAARTLRIYDRAYAQLVDEGQPQAFRRFLLDAPGLFAQLGDRLGMVSHIVSFWTYRFPPGEPWAVSVEELTDIFMEFEAGLNMEEPSRAEPPRITALRR